MASAALPLPRRDPEARARLQEVARGVAPPVLARERLLAVPGPLGELLPGGGVQRGSVVTLDGPPGGGRTSIALQLVVAATAGGEWAAAIDPAGTYGGAALGEAGVVLERFAVVRGVPASRWARVAGALLDGVALVVADLPDLLTVGDARRLIARARERGGVLVAVAGGPAAWPAEAVLHLYADRCAWPGFGPASGRLGQRSIDVRADGRGARRHGRLDAPRCGYPDGEDQRWRARRASGASELAQRANDPEGGGGYPDGDDQRWRARRASGASELAQRANDPEGGGGYPAAE